ncbi:hypothetical protein [Endozoicomonas numazuensis]|uniref:Uncharacterized protein n=1 Tax=Endozoicomonas numazuensis TaxID=1137799 RepID=A0A081NL74_9GAMM|nr:hypothetical protein [Endozoicomonas numazuensis]KEQ19197.1 hypothetical protein GZ78_04165 [Endozoicomonas numazuensis]
MTELKPVTEIKKRSLKRARLVGLEEDLGRVWQLLRTLKGATSRALSMKTGLRECKVRYYLSFLERAGYLWREPKGSKARFWLIHNTGPVAPYRLHGGHAVSDLNTKQVYEVPVDIRRWPGPPAEAGSEAFKIWQGMRMLRNFTVSELKGVTEVDKAVIQMQVSQLHQFNYLRRSQDSLGEPSYLLPQYRNTGEKPPAVNMQLGRLYDYKTKEIIVLEEVC